MPLKKINVLTKSNTTEKKVKEKIINDLKDSEGFIFISIKKNKLTTAHGMQGANGVQLISLSKELRRESERLILLVEDAIEKHFGTTPKGVS